MKKILGLMLLCGIANAYTITHSDYTSGGTISASGQNTNENNIVNVINGNLDTTNIAANGVGTTQLTAQSVTAAKIANNTVTDTQISANGLNGNVDLASGTIQGTSANSSGNQGSIKQGTISTPDFRANAITLTASSNTTSGSFTGSTTISTASITSIGQPILVIGNCSFNVFPNASPAILQMAMYEDNATFASNSGNCSFYQTGNPGLTCTIPITALRTPSAGTHTYSLRYLLSSGIASVTIINCTTIAVELRS